MQTTIKNKNKSIVVMLAYARSGGTLLNRCMASIPNVLVLSEVSVEALCPNSCSTIKEQAKKWYGLELKSSGFVENINEIYKYCQSRGITLVIRDWTFGSFVPSRYNNFMPSKSLSTYNVLSKHFSVKAFGLVRNSIDIWLSLQASPRTFYDKNLEFLYEFTKNLIDENIKFFKYEDFCNNPKKEMKAICDYVEIDYNDHFLNYCEYKNVTGDIDLPDYSRGIKQSEISLLSRRKSYNIFSNDISKNTRSHEINQLLNYDSIEHNSHFIKGGHFENNSRQNLFKCKNLGSL